MALGKRVTRQGDDEIPAIGPCYTHPAIVFVGSFHEIRLDMERRPSDLSGIGKALEVGPCQVTERPAGRGHESPRTEVVQIQAGVSSAGFLHSHEPLRI